MQMTTGTSTSTGTWASTREFNKLDAPVAEAVLTEVYAHIAIQPDEQRLHALRLMARDEHALNDLELREFTARRLRAWLQLSKAAVSAVSASYNSVMNEMPANVAMRRVGMVQSVLASMSANEQERLRDLLPSAMTGMRLGGLNVSQSRVPATKKRRRWNFWRGSA
jgi:hypothetical protein